MKFTSFLSVRAPRSPNVFISHFGQFLHVLQFFIGSIIDIQKLTTKRNFDTKVNEMCTLTIFYEDSPVFANYRLWLKIQSTHSELSPHANNVWSPRPDKSLLVNQPVQLDLKSKRNITSNHWKTGVISLALVNIL